MYDYPITIRKLTKEEGGGFLAEALDLQGCMSDGETVQEAVDNVQDAIKCWVVGALETGDLIPEPSTDNDYNGKILFRSPKRIHRKLSEMSKKEGMSVNSIMLSIIAEGLGMKQNIYK